MVRRRERSRRGKRQGGRQREGQDSTSAQPRTESSALQMAWRQLRAGDLDAAEAIVGPLFRQQPRTADILHLAGVIAHRRGNNQPAVELLSEAIRLEDTNADAFETLGAALASLGRVRQAIRAFGRALAINPRFAEAHANLGAMFVLMSRPDQAMPALRAALSLDPRLAAAHRSLGKALKDMDQLEEAVEAYQRSLELDSSSLLAHHRLGHTLFLQGRVDEGLAVFRRALELSPGAADVHSGVLANLNYCAAFDPGTVYAEHQRWYERHAAGLRGRVEAHSNDPSPERRLRIGYVSPDFRTHSVAYFFEPLLFGHARSRFEIVCYSDVDQPDAVTQRLRESADAWREVSGLNDETVAERVRSDGIDILVDLGGHMMDNRLLVFARKPAPVQVSYLGYPNTTGLPTMDYRLTDAWADPVGKTDAWYCETLVRLPNGFLCYRPPPESPDVAEPPSITTGWVTFGSFNNIRKVRPEVIEAWARILQGVPGSRLLLKHKSYTDPGTRARIHARFAEHGVSSETVELLGWTVSQEAHLRLYHGVDVALDTFPYNGTTTTCEALWMGVPVVSLAGETHASRVGSSLLSRLNLSDSVAGSEQEYVEKAVSLGQDPRQLRELRTTLRERMSSLTDAELFTTELEQAFREMWRRWCSEHQ